MEIGEKFDSSSVVVQVFKIDECIESQPTALVVSRLINTS